MKRTYGLSSEQEAVLLAMLSGKSQKEAAEAGGVAPETVSRWLAEPIGVFRDAYSARRSALWKFQESRLRTLGEKAVSVVERAMDSESEPVRLRAALAVLKAIGLDDDS